MKHTEDTLRNVDARSEGDTAGTMTVGRAGRERDEVLQKVKDKGETFGGCKSCEF